MKTVKIKFVGFWDGFDPDTLFVYRILKKYYNVQVTDDADYIICSAFGEVPYCYCEYPQVRIFTSGENYTPDFNLVDYGISNYPITFLDRHFRHPGILDAYGHGQSLQHKDRNYTAEWLQSKSRFCNFITSHDSEYNIRGDFFKKLCQYKRVDSPGAYLNNMDTPISVNWMDDSKTEFQRTCKFTLCFERVAHPGFCTEKISDAFFADTIPIYFGDSHIDEIFNPKAFIDVSRFDSWDGAIQKIIELDTDDEKYLEMMRQPIFVDPEYPEKVLHDEEAFICHIFDQPLEKAFRRSRDCQPQIYDTFLTHVVQEQKEELERQKKRENSRLLKTADRLQRKGRKLLHAIAGQK